MIDGRLAHIERADPWASTTIKAYFEAKSRHDVAGTTSFFSPELIAYIDATLDVPMYGFDAIYSVYAQIMPQWPVEALSYPVRILGGPESALVEFIDTKEMFGDELRLFATIDFRDGKIIRWVDLWDGSSITSQTYEAMRVYSQSDPFSYRADMIRDNCSARIRETASALQHALSAGKAERAAALFSYEAIFEDRAMRSQIIGRAAIERYLARTRAHAPYANGATLRHVVGGDLGGGFEWVCDLPKPIQGMTALELDAEGLIVHASTLYDGRAVALSSRNSLCLAALESPER